MKYSGLFSRVKQMMSGWLSNTSREFIAIFQGFQSINGNLVSVVKFIRLLLYYILFIEVSIRI